MYRRMKSVFIGGYQSIKSYKNDALFSFESKNVFLHNDENNFLCSEMGGENVLTSITHLVNLTFVFFKNKIIEVYDFIIFFGSYIRFI